MGKYTGVRDGEGEGGKGDFIIPTYKTFLLASNMFELLVLFDYLS